ncbi:predicted protein [Culex quinquefasciatus]|uniref:Predicted protein n=2 Tax=Culex pipiens complex TaxID=518105 RepID=B0W3A3_CULQU|nr:predicted protein [Culex quinquefasciatus]|eukprot:XP_001843187.1 predicted protein [Culex quinquefasciatus]
MGVWMSRPFEVVPNQKGGKNLLFFNYVYRKEASFKTSINWVCNQNVVSRCQARIVQKTVSGELKLGKHGHNHDPVKIPPDSECIAVFTMTMRGKEQLLYLGQPFVFEKLVVTPTAEPKKIWRCNQWWNQKCRARVYTIGNVITPLNRYHTHSDIVKRKRRVTKKKVAPVSFISAEDAIGSSGDSAGKVMDEEVAEYVVNIEDQKKIELPDY